MTSFQTSLLYTIKSPWTSFIVGRLIFAYGAGFTSPNSATRLTVFVILCIYAGITLANYTTYIRSTSYWSSIFAGTILAPTLVYFDRLIQRKWRFEDRHAIFSTNLDQKSEDYATKQSKTPAKTADRSDPEDTTQARFAFGNEVSGTVRGPGTAWEVKGLPHFSSNDPQWVPSPLLFIVSKTAVFLACFFLNDYAVDAREALDKDLLQPSKVPFLSRLDEVTKEELWTRFVVALTFWTMAYFLLQVLFSVPATIAVILKPSSVAEWRPVFGSFSELYTVRGFWGKFWHQNLQLNLQGPARFITYDVLRLPRSGLIQRYTLIFLVFFVSGCFHVVTDMAASIPPSDSGVVRFFCTQALGIMLEDGAQEIFRRLGGRHGLLSRLLGYVWLVVFLSWSTPAWQYPAILVTKREDIVLRLGSFRSMGPPGKL